MWKMLIEKRKGNIKLNSQIYDEYIGSAHWIATYNFSKTTESSKYYSGINFNLKMDSSSKTFDNSDIWNGPNKLWNYRIFIRLDRFSTKIQPKALLS
jgi:hypothetical protein